MSNARRVARFFVGLAAALGVVVAAGACSPFGLSCNAVGCTDGATIERRTGVTEGGLGEHLFFIEIDGAARCCVLERERADYVAQATCDPGLELSTAPLYQAQPIDTPCCASSLPPLEGYRWELHVDGFPASVRVRHLRRLGAEAAGGGDVIVSDDVVALSYTKLEPNGEACGPTCHSARASIP